MRKLLLLIFGISTLVLLGQSGNNEFFTMKEMRLPRDYRALIENMIIPYINKMNYDKRNTVIDISYRWADIDVLDITVETMPFSDYNYSLYYQYCDSILIITSHPEFGKYIVPNSQRLFMKTPRDTIFFIMDYDPPLWRVRDKDSVWGIIREPRLINIP